ncbi:SRR1-like protein [Sorex araneus]|uniref:SRR1-like protein n=1 Tax=Sorex araneus TaxID=42254 RepID=UPI002433FF0D|nr:SRR1-like protein [Sorex araneus]
MAAAATAAARDPWRAAARRSRRAAAAAARGPENGEVTREADVAVVLRRLREAEENLLLSDFWSSALETISSCLSKLLEQLSAPTVPLCEALGSLRLEPAVGEPPAALEAHPGTRPGRGPLKCVCYGLGNFATCVIARHQLAFLLLFLEKCQVPRSHCCVYDPLFSPCETAALQALGVTVLSENEEGKRSVSGEPTLFYMPHCGTALYNNLLWRNWSPDALSHMLIIGNSFGALQDRMLTRILQKNYPYIAKILQGLEELPIPETPQYSDTFNDTSVHWFPEPKLRQLPEDTWACREEPDYGDCEDLEIIRNERVS